MVQRRPGDYLFVSKLSYGYSRYSLPWGIIPFEGRVFGTEPKRGDVVVFKLPRDNSTDFIKRVIGLPGDHVEVRNGVVSVNGQAAPQTPAGEYAGPEESRPKPRYGRRCPTASSTTCCIGSARETSTTPGPSMSRRVDTS